MPRQRQFYDPIIEAAQPPETFEGGGATMPPTIQGLEAVATGTYWRLDDLIAYLLWASESFPTEPERMAILAVAEAFGWRETPSEDVVPVPEGETLSDQITVLPSGEGFVEAWMATNPDPHPEVARIETYPNEDGTYFYARPVNAEGAIMAEPLGSIRREQVVEAALGQWPSKPIYEVPDAMGDSVWDEQVTVFGFNGRRRPSPRRLWNQ